MKPAAAFACACLIAQVAACKKSESGSPGVPGPTSTAEADALWALAPAGAEIGIVASPRAIELIDGGATTVRARLAKVPELAELKAQLAGALAELGGYDVTLADAGLGPAKGAALFVVKEEQIAILPVVDRDKFVAKAKGTRGQGADGADRVGKATCKVVRGYYACARAEAALATLGGGQLAAQLAAVDRGARGDVELVVNGMPVSSARTINLAAVVQLARGAGVVRAVIDGVPPEVGERLGAPSKPDAAKTASGFAMIDPRALFGNLPPVPLPGGVTLADVARSIAGPLRLAVPSGRMGFVGELPLSDAAPARAVVGACEQIGTLTGLPMTLDGGTCKVVVPQATLELELRVDDQALRIGAPGPRDGAVAMTPIGAELADGAWSAVVWGRGTVVGPTAMPAMPGELPAQAAIAVRALTLLEELGFAARRDGERVHVVLALATAFANPDAVVDQLLAIPPADIVAGRAGARAQQIADGAPGSPFATHLRSGQGGLMMPTALIGMISAVAIPAFLDYMKKSKVSEAVLQLNRIAKYAKAAYLTDGKYPVGEAGPTPAAPCCDGPGRKCSASWTDPVWQALDFRIDDPHLYQYTYKSDGAAFTATAIGDLDCDGTTITYELRGDANGTTALIEPPPNSD